ncbi:MAG TPA: biotin/lipoyl-containing protein, partial [Sphingomicrobium sp.]
MSATIEVKVPDIGDFKDVPVIEVFVKPGDAVKPEDPLVSLESDKATMDVPAPVGGVVKEVKVKVGDLLSEGSLIMLFDGGGVGSGNGASPGGASAAAAASAPAAPVAAVKPSVVAPPSPVHAPAGTAEVRIPDIGDFKDIPIIEIFVKVGDTVKPEDPLISLESDKATMDVPAPLGGTVQKLLVNVGDTVSEGTPIMVLGTAGASGTPTTMEAVSGGAAAAASAGGTSADGTSAGAGSASAASGSASSGAAAGGIDEAAFAKAYAGPAVRKLARELGIDLGKVTGTGQYGRITLEDVQGFSKSGGAAPA